MADVQKILSSLGLTQDNAGTWTTTGGWRKSTGGKVIESINPATGGVIAKVHCATEADYEQVVKDAEEAFKVWREVPAPKRGEAVRLVGEELRKHKDALGSLVSLEMGKIKPEGDGEVQEMIDIADFAVGQSRMLYGRTMQSERARHRMAEQWHPLGIVGVISAFNFPVAVCWSGTAIPRSSPCLSTATTAWRSASSRTIAWPWCPSPAPPPSAARSVRWYRRAWESRCWSSAATTPSWWTRPPT
jgi:aldehyde dehydrogenase (NAD+)